MAAALIKPDRLEPFGLAAGPRSEVAIAFVGEAPGENEDITGMPFIGTAGTILTQLCKVSGIDRSACFITNVVNVRPPRNDMEAFYVSRTALPEGYNLPPISRGKFLDPSLAEQVERLRAELDAVRPRVIVALGNTALWALTGRSGISKERGVVAWATGPAAPAQRTKVIGTFHPAAIARQWGNFVIAARDLSKALKHVAEPGIHVSRRRILFSPTIGELDAYVPELIGRCDREHLRLAIDIETKRDQITCIGFGTSSEGVVIPFYDPDSEQLNYWQDPRDEARAWRHVSNLCRTPAPKVFQNGLYDMSYLWLICKIAVRNPAYDTMLMHHALQPELPKSLGFLGSLHVDEPSWKHLREDAKRIVDTSKKED